MTLTGLTQTEFDLAETTLLESVRDSAPALDIRRGTVLRELLIRPAATLQALADTRAAELLGKVTLAQLADSASPDPETMNALLSNFDLTYLSGTKASGYIKLYFTAPDTVILGTDTVFTTPDGISITLPDTSVISANGAGYLLSPTSDGRYVVVLPAVAVAEGSAGNIPQGIVLTAQQQIVGLDSGFAYASFSGGSDAETVTQSIARIKPALAARSLTNAVSVLGVLRDRFGVTIKSLSLSGFGSATQWRDRANIIGISSGSHVDAYVRTFDAAPITVLRLSGTRQGDGSYQIVLPQTAAAGCYAVRAVTDDDTTETPVESPSLSYTYTETRGYVESDHRIPSTALAAYTKYQTLVISVTGVPSTAATHAFKVELYQAPEIAAVQDYVDSTAVRNEGVDFLVRMPLLCLVSLKVIAYKRPDTPLTASQLQTAITAYVNGLQFQGKLSASELIKVICDQGAVRVGMRPGELTLSGRIRGSDGNWVSLTGDHLIDLNELALTQHLISPATVVFVVDPADLDITVRTES